MKQEIKKINLCLCISVILSLIICIWLYLEDKPKILLPQNFQGGIVQTMNYSDNTIVRELEILLEPSYFFSIGEVTVALRPLQLENIKVEMSVDGISWHHINISKKNDNLLYFSIGEVPLNQNFKIYMRIQKISDGPFINTYYVNPDIKIKIDEFKLAGLRLVLLFLTFFAVLGTIFSILMGYRSILYHKYYLVEEKIKITNKKIVDEIISKILFLKRIWLFTITKKLPSRQIFSYLLQIQYLI